ncbi:hypothetical protein KIPE111705_02700 [Kibdelosporangium persicum]
MAVQCTSSSPTAVVGAPGRTKPQPTNGRPYPGARVKTKHEIRGHYRFGTVALYEWDWNGLLFPVDIDHVGTRLFAVADVEIVDQ